MTRRSGLSLVEVMIALGILALAFLAIISLILSSGRVQEEAGERTRAYNAARQVVEEMRAQTLAQVYAVYRPGGTTGSSFAVAGLSQGRAFVDFPIAGGGIAETLSDKTRAADFGLPKDLNRDGDSADVGLTSFALLPVKVSVTWRVPGGKSNQVDVLTYLGER